MEIPTGQEVVGSCSQCNGLVVIPNFRRKENAPLGKCQSCGAIAVGDRWPIIKTKHPGRHSSSFDGYYTDTGW